MSPALLPNCHVSLGAILPSLGLSLLISPVRGAQEGTLKRYGLACSSLPCCEPTCRLPSHSPGPCRKARTGEVVGEAFFSGQYHLLKGRAALPPCPAASLVPNVCPGQMTDPGLLATVDRRLLLVSQAELPPSPSLLNRKKKKSCGRDHHVCLYAPVGMCVRLHTRAAPLPANVNSTRSHRKLSPMKWKVEHKSVSAALLAMHQ